MKIRTDLPWRFIMSCTDVAKTFTRKSLWLLSLFLLSISFASAQDVIVKNDGRTIESRVIEVGETVVKYKKYSKPNGPIYTIPISDIRTIYYEDEGKDGYDSPQSNNYDKDDYYQPETMTSNDYAGRSSSSSKSLSAWDFCFYGLSYTADLDYFDKGTYSFGGHVFYPNGIGVSFYEGFNFEFDVVQTKIGPSYCVPFSNIAFFYVPLQAVLNWTFIEGEDDPKFGWGAELTPSIGLKFGHIVIAAGVALDWAEGADKISTNLNLNLGWAFN